VMDLSVDARLGTVVELTTWCGGSGPRWAERCTRVAHDRGVVAEIRAVWVRVDRTTGAPRSLPDRFHEVYGPSSRRRVRARLEHPPPDPASESRSWALRATDFDVLGHVNNAVYWAPVEDALAAAAPEAATVTGRPAVRRAEMEYRGGVDPGDDVRLVFGIGDPARVWFTVGGEVRASAAFWAD